MFAFKINKHDSIYFKGQCYNRENNKRKIQNIDVQHYYTLQVKKKTGQNTEDTRIEFEITFCFLSVNNITLQTKDKSQFTIIKIRLFETELSFKAKLIIVKITCNILAA